MSLFHLGAYIFWCVVLWFGAGRIIYAVEAFSKSLRISPFSSSFVLLGILTSIPEIAVAITSTVEKTPAVSVGNLLGGIPVIFMVAIPLLAILGGGIKINHDLSKTNLLLSFGVIAAPALFVLDQKVTSLEGVISIVLYLFLVFSIEKKQNIFALPAKKQKLGKFGGSTMFPIIMGTVLVFVASHFIIKETLFFAKLLSLPPFYISVIMLSLGTNLPEISLAIRGALSKKNDVAFGDYMGSASANTLVFGFLGVVSGGFVISDTAATVVGVTAGLILFYEFARSRRTITSIEGLMLVVCYAVFVFFELHGAR